MKRGESVRCTRCGAAPGAPCIGQRGKLVTTHFDRVEMAERNDRRQGLDEHPITAAHKAECAVCS